MSNKPLSVDQALIRAKSLAKKGELDQAMEFYRAVLESFPGNKRATEGLELLMLQKHGQEQNVVSTESTQEQIDGLIALYNQRRLQEALELGTALAERYPNAPLILNILGAVNSGLGRLDQAVESYIKALQIKPDYAEAHNNLGSTFKALGRHEEAITSLTKALQIKPDYAEAHYNLGSALKALGRHEEAITSLTKALKIKPDHAEAYNNLGNVLKAAGKHENAIASYTKALHIKPDFAEAHYNIGIAEIELGMHEAAIASYTKALQIRPDHAEAHYNLGNALNDLGKHEEAIASYTKALQIMPDHAEAHNNLGNSLNELGKHEAAIASYTQALQINPDHAEAHNNLGNALKALGKHEEAIASYTKALQIKPDHAEAHYNLGNALNDLGRHEEAIASYTKALQTKPEFAEANSNLGIAFKAVGRNEEAITSLTKALQIKPDFAEVQRVLGTLVKYKTDDPRIAQMLEQIAAQPMAEVDKMHLSFALGKAFDDIGDAESSFKHFLEGNRLRKKELGCNIDSYKKLFNLLKSIFGADDLPTLEKSQPFTGCEKQPIFIVGMPRSGTTLTEQILASHSKVYGAGELEVLNRTINPILDDLRQTNAGRITASALAVTRSGYFAEIDSLGAGETHVTDKMPLNFIWTGFILTAMPEAKVINLQRSPVATCWSVFKHYFSSKGNKYAYDLIDVAEYYKLYIDLMGFWRERFPNRIYDLNYETLTESQEEETRKLLDHCGLDWEGQCLEFHKTKRAVTTASSAQVRQEMYKGSSEAWRKYETHIQPMLQALEGQS